MKQFRLLCLSLLCVAFTALPLRAQWNTTLATQDDTPNGTGYQTISVAVINSHCFVALVDRPIMKSWSDDVNFTDSSSCNYLVGYIDATDFTGRVDRIPYGSATVGLFSKWASGFDEINLNRAYKAFGTPDSLVYVANNDADHNILVFKLTKDSTITTEWRMKTGTEDIQGLAVDSVGYVYVCAINGTTANTKEVKVFKGIKATGSTWGSTYDDTPVSTIDLPAGTYRGLAVSPDGKMIFVSDQANRTVSKYVGSPTTGYTKATAFAFTESVNDTIPRTAYDTLGTTAWNVGRPLGLGYLKGNNIVYVATARLFGNTIFTHAGTSGYEYSKIIGLNAMTGVPVDSIDVAQYYFEKTGGYTTQLFGDTAHASGYTSSYDVGFDEQKNLYSQSMYSWTVERWKYTGTLPTIPLTSVKQTKDAIPAGYELTSNYPNPFNPSTKFNFSIPKAQFVSIQIFDLLGREVATLANGTMHAGTYTVEWNASDVPSGVYLYRLRAGSFVETKKMTLMK